MKKAFLSLLVFFGLISTGSAFGAETDLTAEEKRQFALLGAKITDGRAQIENLANLKLFELRNDGEFTRQAFDKMGLIVEAREHLISPEVQNRIRNGGELPPSDSDDPVSEGVHNPEFPGARTRFSSIDEFNSTHRNYSIEDLVRRQLGLALPIYVGRDVPVRYLDEVLGNEITVNGKTTRASINPQFLTAALYEFHLKNVSVLVGMFQGNPSEETTKRNNFIIGEAKIHLTNVALQSDEIPLAHILEIARRENVNVDPRGIFNDKRQLSTEDLRETFQFPWTRRSSEVLKMSYINFVLSAPHLKDSFERMKMGKVAYNQVSRPSRVVFREVSRAIFSQLLEVKRMELIEDPQLCLQLFNFSSDLEIFHADKFDLASLIMDFGRPSYAELSRILEELFPFLLQLRENKDDALYLATAQHAEDFLRSLGEYIGRNRYSDYEKAVVLKFIKENDPYPEPTAVIKLPSPSCDAKLRRS